MLPVIAAGVAAMLFDADALRPRVATAVEGATGRSLAIGRIGLAFTPLPTVTITEAVLANPAGASREHMLRVGRAEAGVALWPLLQGEVVIRTLRLDGIDLLLETDTAGQPNWIFSPAARPAAEPAATATEAGRALGIVVERLVVEGARIGYRNGRNGRTETVGIATLAAMPRPAEQLAIDAALTVRGRPIRLAGEIGDLRRLAAAGPATPYPVALTLTAAGATLSIAGEATAPMRGTGWRATIDGAVPALDSLAGFVSEAPLPPLRDVTFRATVTAPAGGPPTLGDVALAVGDSDLAVLWPRLRLARLTAQGAAGQPIRVVVAARAGDLPLDATAELGRALPLPIAATMVAGTVTLSATGTVALPAAAPLAMESAAPGSPGVAVAPGPVEGPGALAGPANGPVPSLVLTNLSVTGVPGDLAGEATFRFAAKPAIEAQFASRRLDLDALRGAVASLDFGPAETLPQPATPPSTPAEAATSAPPPPAGVAPSRGRTAAPPATAVPARRIPDLPLPLDLARRLDVSLGWNVAELTAGGTVFRNVAFEAKTADDRATATVATPTGRLRATAVAETAATPTLHVTAAAEGADAAALLAAIGAPKTIHGRLDLELDLRGSGATTRAFAASATGTAGIALVDGRADAALLRALPGEVRSLVLPPGAATAEGDLPLRCVALRADFAAGIATFRSLLLDLPIGRIGGGGTINLGDETLSLRLLPDIRVGPVQLRAPVRVAGTLAAPRVAVPVESAVAGGVGALLSLQRSADRGLQELAATLGAGSGPPDCPTALAVARGGRTGAQPGTAPAPEVSREPERRLPVPAPLQDVLRGLLGR